MLISAVVAGAGHLDVATITKIATAAFATGIVVATMPADSHPLTFVPHRHTRANFINHPRDFVSRNPRKLDSRQKSFFHEHVAVADATGLDLNAHMSCIGPRNLAIDDLKIPSGLGNLSSLHGCGCWFGCDSQRCHKSSWVFRFTYGFP